MPRPASATGYAMSCTPDGKSRWAYQLVSLTSKKGDAPFVDHYNKPSNDVDMLRTVVGKSVDDIALKSLLSRGGGDVSAAVNLFFDGSKPMTPRLKAPPTGGFLDHLALAEARDGAGQQAAIPLAVGVSVPFATAVPFAPAMALTTKPDSARPSRPQTPREAVPMGLPVAQPVAVHFSHEGPHVMAAPAAMDAQMAAEMVDLRARVTRAEAQAAAAAECAAAQADAQIKAAEELALAAAVERSKREAAEQRAARAAAKAAEEKAVAEKADADEAARWRRDMAAAEAREAALRRAADEERRRRQEAEERAAEARAAEARATEAREAEVRQEARRWAAEQEERRAKAAREMRMQRAQAEASSSGLPPSGKWVGRGHNKQNGFTYRVTFYLTFGDDGRVTGVAVPPNAFQGFGRVNLAGHLNRADDTARLDHTCQAGWTQCRFSRSRGHEWSLHCDWNMCNLTGWYGTHDLTFSGDTRTTPGGFSLFG